MAEPNVGLKSVGPAATPFEESTSQPINARLVTELSATSLSYDKESYVKYRDFFEGGENFRKNTKNYLRMRAFEAQSGMSGGLSKFFQQRVSSASYTNILGGLISWLASCALSSEPRINARTLYKPEDMPLDSDSTDIAAKKKVRRDLIDQKNASRIKYYQNLNKNADGKGNSILDVSRLRLVDAMVYGRGYFSVVFPDPEFDLEGTAIDYPNKVAQREAGGLDAFIDGLSPLEVIDWEYDRKTGKLQWVKTHCVEYGRDSAWGSITKECNYWTFIDAEGTYCYRADRTLKQAEDDEWPDGDKQVATLFETSTHSIGQPIVDLRVNPDFHVMSKLWGTGWELFNREAALSFSLDCQAIALPTLKTNRKAPELGGNFVMSELALILIQIDETLEFIAPPGTHFEASAKHIETKKDDLYAQIMAMSAQSSQIPSAGRMSGISKKIDVQMLSAFLSVFASLIKTGLNKTLQIIQRARGDDDLCVHVEGLDRFIINDVELMLKKIKEMCDLPGSVTAKRYALGKVAEAVCSDADIVTLDKIRQESEALTAEELGKDTSKDSPGDNSDPESSASSESEE